MLIETIFGFEFHLVIFVVYFSKQRLLLVLRKLMDETIVTTSKLRTVWHMVSSSAYTLDNNNQQSFHFLLSNPKKL